MATNVNKAASARQGTSACNGDRFCSWNRADIRFRPRAAVGGVLPIHELERRCSPSMLFRVMRVSSGGAKASDAGRHWDIDL
jgi:hypothetical protein